MLGAYFSRLRQFLVVCSPAMCSYSVVGLRCVVSPPLHNLTGHLEKIDHYDAASDDKDELGNKWISRR